MKLLPLAFVKVRPALPRVRLRGSRRPESRSAVLMGVVLFLAANLGLAAIVETKRPQWRDPEFFHRRNNLLVLQRWIQERQPDKSLIVILGGSRPQMGLSPEAMHRAIGETPADPVIFNCSQSGSLPVGELLNFQRILDAGVRPNRALIEVLPPVLADPGPMEQRIPLERLSAKDEAHLRPYHDDPAGTELRRLEKRINSWYWLRLPLRSASRIETLLPGDPASPHHLWTGMTFHGWGPFTPREWPASVREPKLAAAVGSYSKLMIDFDIRPVNDRIYRDLLAECRRRGIQAALFTMPESPAFRAAYPPAARARINRYLESLAAEHGIPFFDCSTWFEDEDAYMDGHHLLGPAAADFSRRFGLECVRPWIAGSK